MFFLVPVLAQVAVLNVTDRTEARVVDAGQRSAQADTRPLASLGMMWRKGGLTLQYSPSFTLAPLDQEPRYFTMVQGIGLSGAYRYRRTAIAVGEYLSFGDRNLRQEMLAAAQPVAPQPAEPAPQPTTGTKGDGTTDNGGKQSNGNGSTGATNPGTASEGPQVRAADGTYSFAALTTSVGVSQELSARARLSVVGSYLYAGGQGAAARLVYPVTKSPGGLVSLAYALDRRNAVSSSLSLAYVSVNHSDVWFSTLSEAWAHQLGRATSSSLSVGVSTTRQSQIDGSVRYSIFPTFGANVSHALALRKDGLTFGATASSAPVLDPVRQVVDPRVNMGLSVGYSRQKFFTTLTGSSVLSLQGAHSEGSFSSFATAYSLGYRLAKPISVDGGVRAAWQRYEGKVLFGPAWAVFVGVTLTTGVTLSGHH